MTSEAKRGAAVQRAADRRIVRKHMASLQKQAKIPALADGAQTAFQTCGWILDDIAHRVRLANERKGGRGRK